jgi:alkylhydroperoxidase family enzyme
MSITTPDNLIRPEVQLTGSDGNAFAVMGAVSKALRRAGNDPEVIAAFRAEATSGDYDHVLQTAMAYAEVS